MRVTHDIWIDLADRESDGLEVTLLWSAPTGRVKVLVEDAKSEETFELDVPQADALAAFHHPFAYSPDRAVRVHASTDLQLQS
jgi:hypothetical protein